MKPVSDFRFAVIVRTQGKRPALLAETLASLSYQRPVCEAVLTVHAPWERVTEVTAICRASGVPHTVLHAGDLARRRGYPLNVGLAHCYDVGGFDALFFLDDDDIVYPTFTRRMAQALTATGADVVYAASNQRDLQGVPEAGYAPLHFAQLLVQNFIPINSYSIRFSRLIATRPFFDESMDYTEDWLFLLQLLSLGLRFEPLSETLSEFRIISDGNTAVKKEPMKWERDEQKIRKYINTTTFPVAGDALGHMALQMSAAQAASLSVLDSRNTPADPRALLLWERLRHFWHRMPVSGRRAIVRLYQLYLLRGWRRNS